MSLIKLDGDNGPIIITPTVHNDDRGYFFESFNEKQFKDEIGDVNFVQDNESKSSYGVLRGLHFQKPPYAQAKLVRVVKGAVMDIVVDIRKSSPSYGKWFGAYLSEENHHQFFVPRGFAHGFVSLRDDTIFQYKCDNFYNKESEGNIAPLDADLNIPWGQLVNFTDVKLSDKDILGQRFKDFVTEFE